MMKTSMNVLENQPGSQGMPGTKWELLSRVSWLLHPKAILCFVSRRSEWYQWCHRASE